MQAQPRPLPAPLPEERRYERKYRVEACEREAVEAIIRTHPALFREIHSPRWICNVYYDTPDWRFFREHVEGVSRRTKIRLRWYGDDGGAGSLEIKGKEGLIVTKRRFDAARIPDSVREPLQRLVPVLFNRYRRRYFLSRDGHFRATVDSDMEFRGPRRGDLRRLCDPAIVLELKYPVDLHDQAADVTSRLPFPVSKNSKYITGVTLLRRNP